MIFPDGNDYYPLDIDVILSKDGEVLYDIAKRNKSYVYLAIEEED